MDTPITNAQVDERKCYQKLRYILPISFLIAFTTIYLIWKDYPNRLIRDDRSESAYKEESLQNRNLNDLGLWMYGVNSQLNIPNLISLQENTLQSKYEEIGSKYGTYGDTYGSLNTLFTGWAFAGLIISIFLQMLELKATRKELAEQKEALVGQQAEFSAQTEILNKQIDLVGEQKTIAENQSIIINNQLIESRKQNFTSLFNGLLEERRFKIECFKIYPIGEKSKDLDGFEVIVSYADNFIRRLSSLNKHSQLIEILKKFESKDISVDVMNPREVILNHWRDYESYETRNYVIGNYFTIIFTMFHLIEEYKEDLGSSYNFYIEMIKRIINQQELIVLFWISLGHPANDEMIYRYQLFERLAYTEGMGVLGRNIFRIEAFGSNLNWQKCFDQN